MTPKVSIVCRTYNHSKIIDETILSVLAQTFTDWELIISDDCSTDDTVLKVKKYNDSRIKILTSDKNIGIISNLNKVISYGTGKYISILDGDDVYYPQKLQKQVDFLDNNPDYGAVFSYLDFICSEKNNITQMLALLLNNPSKSKEEMLAKFFYKKDNYLAFPTEMFKRELIVQFPENIIAMGDYNFHIKTLLKTKIKVLEEPLVKYRISFINQTSNWYTQMSNDVERMSVTDSFLQINDVEFFKKIFKDEYQKYGEPTQKAIPYFLCRIAMNFKHIEFWGHHTLSKLFSDKEYFDYICKTYNISYKEYISIKSFSLFKNKTVFKVKFLGVTILKKMIQKKSIKYYLFGFLPIYKRNLLK